MFNEEFRAVLRRNLYSLDHEDVASLFAKNLLNTFKVNKKANVSSDLLESHI